MNRNNNIKSIEEVCQKRKIGIWYYMLILSKFSLVIVSTEKCMSAISFFRRIRLVVPVNSLHFIPYVPVPNLLPSNVFCNARFERVVAC